MFAICASFLVCQQTKKYLLLFALLHFNAHKYDTIVQPKFDIRM